MKRGIIFDLDGTLWDSTEQIIPAWNNVLSRHNQRNITAEDMAGYMGRTLNDIAEIMLPELPHKQAMSILNECCKEEQVYLRLHGATLYPKLEQTLEILKEKYGLYIVSNCHSEYLDSFFTAHKLGSLFLDFETHGNTGMSKAENIKLIIQRNRIERSVYVGDTVQDKDSAELAGIPFIYASYGFGKVTDAQYMIKSFSELAGIVGDIV